MGIRGNDNPPEHNDYPRSYPRQILSITVCFPPKEPFRIGYIESEVMPRGRLIDRSVWRCQTVLVEIWHPDTPLCCGGWQR
jgi:hypothetical protein